MTTTGGLSFSQQGLVRHRIFVKNSFFTKVESASKNHPMSQQRLNKHALLCINFTRLYLGILFDFIAILES